MRISTAQLQQLGLGNIQNQQARLAELQKQIASGQKLSVASDNPADFTQAIGLDETLSRVERFGKNIESMRSRLNLGESTLGQIGGVVGRLRELSVQAANGTQNSQSRSAIAAELEQRLGELVALANSEDGTGRYLFGGTSDGQPPFEQAGTAVNYRGNQQARQMSVGPDQRLPENEPGSELFLRIRDQNGQVESLFTTVQNLINTTRSVPTTAAETAAQQTGFATALSKLESAQNHLLDSRAEVGTRLNTLDSIQERHEAASLQIKTTLSGVRDTDMAAAISDLQAQLTALEVSQQSFVRIQNLSLFSLL